MGTKLLWTSKTFIFNLLTAILAVVSIFVPAVKDVLTAHIAEFGMVWGLAGILLRLVTKDKVVLTE